MKSIYIVCNAYNKDQICSVFTKKEDAEKVAMSFIGGYSSKYVLFESYEDYRNYKNREVKVEEVNICGIDTEDGLPKLCRVYSCENEKFLKIEVGGGKSNIDKSVSSIALCKKHLLRLMKEILDTFGE